MQIQVANNEVTGFELYGMPYRFTDEKYKQHEKLECISYSRATQAFLSDSIVEGGFTRMVMENAALLALMDYLHDYSISCKLLGKSKMLSTKRGSIIVVTEYGELGGCVLKHPNDTFVITQLLKRWEFPKAVCYLGDIMACVMDKLPYVELADVKGNVGYYESHNVGSPYELPVEEAMKGLNLTMWEVSKYAT